MTKKEREEIIRKAKELGAQGKWDARVEMPNGHTMAVHAIYVCCGLDRDPEEDEE